MLRLVVGNPLIMMEMAKVVPDAASYAPVTILVEERGDGVHLSYDFMESFLTPYGNESALKVARDLDATLGDAAEPDEPRLVSGAVVRELQRRKPRCSPPSWLRRSRAMHAVRRWLPAKSARSRRAHVHATAGDKVQASQRLSGNWRAAEWRPCREGIANASLLMA